MYFIVKPCVPLSAVDALKRLTSEVPREAVVFIRGPPVPLNFKVPDNVKSPVILPLPVPLNPFIVGLVNTLFTSVCVAPSKAMVSLAAFGTVIS